MTKQLPFELLKNQFNNQTCIVLGSGPSQSTLPKDTNIFVISCNYSVDYIQKSLNMYQDKEYLENSKTLSRFYTFRALSIYSTNNLGRPSPHQGFSILKETRDGARYIDQLLCPSIFSGFQACVAAKLMGFSKIVAVGLDATPNKPYLYNTAHPTMGKENKKIVAHNKLIHYNYEAFQKYHEEYGIVNCSDTDWAARVDINTVIAQSSPNNNSCLQRIEDIYLANCTKEDKELYLSKNKY